jgi:type IV secretion system protein VirB5
MWFKRVSVRYSHTMPAVTPYQAAQQVWDERIGTARVQAQNWRLMAFGSLAFSFLLAGALGFLAMRSSVTPYVIEVNQEGEIRSVGPAVENYQPTEAQIAYQLSRFIRNVRALPLDPIVLRENWLEAYRYVTARGAMVLNEFARAADPFARVGRESVAIETTSVVRASASSYQVRWVERTYVNGSLGSTQHWTAMLSTVLNTPKDEESLRSNPLGIYIDGLDWSRELDSGDTK